MTSIKTLLFTGIIYNLLTSAVLMLLVHANPRYMMQDYPPQITAHIPPRTREEKKAELIYGFPFLFILAGFPLVLEFVGKFSFQQSFLQIGFQIFVLVFSFNLVDLLILDWLVFCTLTPRFMVLPVTEGNPGYKNYCFHFISFLKGSLFSVIASVCFAGLVEVAFFLISIL
jgi:hypothetical protein